MKATQTQISAWKKKYNDVYEVEVIIDEESNDKAYCYVKKPSLDIIMLAQNKMDSDPIEANNILYNNCMIQNDDRINNSDEAKLSVMQYLGGLFNLKESTIKKL